MVEGNGRLQRVERLLLDWHNNTTFSDHAAAGLFLFFESLSGLFLPFGLEVSVVVILAVVTSTERFITSGIPAGVWFRNGVESCDMSFDVFSTTEPTITHLAFDLPGWIRRYVSFAYGHLPTTGFPCDRGRRVGGQAIGSTFVLTTICTGGGIPPIVVALGHHG